MLFTDYEYFSNPDLESIVTPFNVNRFEEFLRHYQYDRAESEFLIDGFRNGFDIGYQGPTEWKSKSENIPLTIGSKDDLWCKIMKEVKAGQVAGPFDSIPFDNYIQSPIGLVPKAGGKTRMIFHLSFTFNNEKESGGSMNGWTPWELCTVKYNDLDAAVRACLKLVKEFGRDFDLISEGDDEDSALVYLGKTDLSSAFRVLPLKIKCICWLVFKATDPRDGKTNLTLRNVFRLSQVSVAHITKDSPMRWNFCWKDVLNQSWAKQSPIIWMTFCSWRSEKCSVMHLFRFS